MTMMNDGKRKRGAKAAVLIWLQDHPNRAVSIDSISAELAEYSRTAIGQTLAVLSATNPKVRRIASGVYEWSNVGAMIEQPKGETLMLVRVVAMIKDDKRLVVDENGQLFKLEPVEL